MQKLLCLQFCQGNVTLLLLFSTTAQVLQQSISEPDTLNAVPRTLPQS